MLTSATETIRKTRALWEDLRGGREAPSIFDFVPDRLGDLADFIVVATLIPGDGEPDFKFAVVGSHIAARFGSQIYGRRLSDLPDSGLADTLLSRYREVARRRVPIDGGGDREVDNVPCSYKALSLPLIDEDTGEVTHVVSAVIYMTTRQYREEAARTAT